MEEEDYLQRALRHTEEGAELFLVSIPADKLPHPFRTELL